MREQMREAFDAVRTSEAYRQRMAQSVQERLAKRTRRHATGMLRYALAAACCFLVLVLVKCIRFVVPEDLNSNDDAAQSLCAGRNFRVRFIAHSIDTDYRCCESPVTE